MNITLDIKNSLQKPQNKIPVKLPKIKNINIKSPDRASNNSDIGYSLSEKIGNNNRSLLNELGNSTLTKDLFYLSHRKINSY